MGSYAANAYGLYDMTGNVWELCHDRFSSSYYRWSPYDNPNGSTESPNRALRGGSWETHDHIQLAYRSSIDTDHRGSGIGFRLALNMGCGNGETNAGEDCDDSGESVTCDADCTLVECGDGMLNATAGEACDDGNLIGDDGCDDHCALTGCGDGEPDVGEACDDGGESATCDADCTAVVCGDGTLNTSAGEECDDGNTLDSDECGAT